LARAKQTSRADARRRYRQALGQDADEVGGEDGSSAAPAGTSAAAKPAARGSGAQAGRPGIGSAFRNAYRRPQYREDLRALPVLLRGRWFLIACAITALGFVAFLAAPSGITSLVLSLVSLPFGGPTIPIFLVGFTAPRASYLLGPALGIVNLIIVALVAPLVPELNPTGNPTDVVVQGALYGLPTAVIFASGAAWYRRFLAASNPGARQGRNGGRSKSAQKAAARR
jgi:hypothetical protein